VEAVWRKDDAPKNGPIERLDVVKPLAKITVYTDATERIAKEKK
jgi:hypothetical protein